MSEDTVVETEAPEEGTATSAEVTVEEPEESDPVEEFQKAWEESRRAEIEAEIRRQLESEFQSKLEAERRQRLDADNQERLRASFQNAIKESRELLTSLPIFNEDGERVQISDEQFQKFVAEPFQKHNATVQQLAQMAVYANLAQVAFESIPESLRASFSEKAQGKPLDEWLLTYAEVMAPHTEKYKALEKDKEVAIKAAEARGYARARKAPVATPRQGEERILTNTPDLSTYSGAARALANGQIDDAQFREIIKKLRG